ncbi:MAG: TolC family protein [Acidobacteriaceae bacterium]
MKSTHKEMRRPIHVRAVLARASQAGMAAAGALLMVGVSTAPIWAQVSGTSPADSSYQGSVVTEKATATTLPLSLDEAIHRGLQHNLGLILQNQNVQSAGGQRLQQLQSLLPTITGSAKVAVTQTNLRAQGLRFPGFPAIIGPYGYTDLRASLTQSLLNVQSLDDYLAAKHNFASSKLTAQDARDLVVLTVGNAYLTCLADASSVASAKAQLATAKVSLDQAIANHDAGTSPKLDLLRAQVDYQSQQQQLIVASNQYEKDKLALARAIGLPLDQSFALTDKAPYAQLDHVDPATAVQQAEQRRSDLKSLEEQVKAAQLQRKAATAERFPTVSFSGDYGDIGVNPNTSHGTGSATGQVSVPVFEEPKLRGDAKVADAALEQKRAELNNMKGQIDADVRDIILDIETAAKLVQVAQSNVALAREALTEAQERFKAGVADNLPVSQAQAQLEQADNQYISALYQHNVAKLTLARALGAADTQYKNYVGGK